MDPTQQAASQIIKGGTVTALTVSKTLISVVQTVLSAAAALPQCAIKNHKNLFRGVYVAKRDLLS